MVSGSTDGVFLDFDSTINRKSIVDLLDAKGISWKSYQQAYPGNCNTASSVGTYYRYRFLTMYDLFSPRLMT
jgi:hypothetical protein